MEEIIMLGIVLVFTAIAVQEIDLEKLKRKFKHE